MAKIDSIIYDEEAKVFVAHCPALNLYSQGKTELKAKSALKDAVHMFLGAPYRKNV